MNQKANKVTLVAACSVAAFVAGRISSRPDTTPVFLPYERAVGDRGTAPPVSLNQLNNAPGVSGANDRPEPRTKSDLRSRKPSGRSTANYDPFLRLEIITSNPDPIERAQQWLNLIDDCDSEEIQFLLDKMTARGTTLDNRLEHSMVMEAWASLHPDAAFDYAVDRPMEGSTRQVIMSYFVSVDPQAAIRMAKANDAAGEGGTGSMLEYAIQALAPTDPDFATKLLSEIGNPQEYNEALETLCLQYMDRGSQAARDWAVGIENEKLRDLVVARVSNNLAADDPEGAADMLIENPGENSAGAMEDVMKQMTRQDSQGAISYLGKITDPATKKFALGGIAFEMAATDPNAALGLIDASPELASDAVLDKFIWGARKSDRALAADTITRIEDQSLRKRTYDRFLEDWSRNDHPGAIKWLESRKFPEALRQTLEKRINYYKGYASLEPYIP